MSDPAGRALTIHIELSETDLAWFKTRLDEARKDRAELDEAAIIAAVRELQDKASKASAPAFVRNRLAELDPLVAMLEDEEWSLTGEHRELVVDALAYFADPDDLIPDDTPVLGFVDDAIIIELVCASLAPEREAYADFVEAREELANAPDPEALARERDAAQSRMRRRRMRRRGRSAWPHATEFDGYSIRF